MRVVSITYSQHLFHFIFACSAFDYDTENMNSEDIYSSLKGVTEAIQNFSVRSQEDMNEPVQRREGDEVGAIVFRLSIYLLFNHHPFLRFF